MKATFKYLTGRLAGKITLTPETPEEENALQAFRQEVGIPQRGRKLDIVYKRRVVGPEAINRILREGATDGQAGRGRAELEGQGDAQEVGGREGLPAGA